MKRSAISVLSIAVSISLLLAACGGTEEPSSKPNTTVNKPAKENKGKSNMAGVTDEVKLTAKSELTADEINALYNEPSIEINGFKRYLSALNALDYIRGTNEARVVSKFFTKIDANREFLQGKDKLVVLVPTDKSLDANGRAKIIEEIIASGDAALQQKALWNHVYRLRGKYLGGDFISIENLKSKKVNQLVKKDGSWYIKDFKLNGEPALVENGIVFFMDTDFFPGD